MARNGSGNYSLPTGNPVATGTTISSTVHNNTMSDIATALTNSLAKDGQTVPTADLPMGTQKHTNVGDADARNQYATAGQVQDCDFNVCSSVSGTNTVTATLSPAITSYSAGMFVVLVPAANNTGAATLALNGLTALDILKDDGDALAAGDLVADVPAFLVLDGGGDDFFLLNPQTAPDVADGSLSSNVPLKNAENVFTTNQTVQSSAPQWRLSETGVTANNGRWSMTADSESFSLRGWDDTWSSSVTFFRVERTANTIDSVNITGTAVQANGSTIFTTSSQVNHDSTTGFVSNEHIDHTSVSPLAGSGLAVTGSDISADFTYSVDLTGLTQMTAADIAGADELLMNDGGTNKALRWQDFGVPRTVDTTTSPLSAADLTYANRVFDCNNASAISAVIPANASIAYPIGTVLGFCQIGAGKVTVSVTTDTLNAPAGLTGTRVRYSTIYARKTDTTTWVMSGDLG